MSEASAAHPARCIYRLLDCQNCLFRDMYKPGMARLLWLMDDSIPG